VSLVEHKKIPIPGKLALFYFCSEILPPVFTGLAAMFRNIPTIKFFAELNSFEITQKLKRLFERHPHNQLICRNNSNVEIAIFKQIERKENGS
jgi:hypothetical protein